MPVPTTIDQLSTTAASNFPAGSDSPASLDDTQRAHAAFIAQLRDAMMPAGTRIPFAQAAAPTGWTQDTSDNATNRMLRVVNTAGGGVAGSDSPILNNVVPSHTHTVTTGGMSANATHTHTDSGHAHGLSVIGTVAAFGSASGGSTYGTVSSTNSASAVISTTNTDHTHSGTTAVNAGAANWAPRYIDLIICAKT